MERRRDQTGESYSIAELSHLLLMAGTNGTLVVAKNSDLTIAIIVELDFLRQCSSRTGIVANLTQQFRHSPRGIVCTEDLGSETIHIAVQMLVQLGSLE